MTCCGEVEWDFRSRILKKKWRDVAVCVHCGYTLWLDECHPAEVTHRKLPDFVRKLKGVDND